MYQYKAILQSSKEVIAENHTIEKIENDIVHYKRQQKKGIHTHANDNISIYHVFRDGTKEKLIKTIAHSEIA